MTFALGFQGMRQRCLSFLNRKYKANLFSGSSRARHTEARILLLVIMLRTGHHQSTVQCLDLWGLNGKASSPGGEESVDFVVSHK